MKSSSNKGASITDRELMLYVDGELDGDRLGDVQRWTAEDPAARRKVAGLRLAGQMLRAHAQAHESGGDGIADEVMARIAANALPELTDADRPPVAIGNGASSASSGARVPLAQARREPVDEARREQPVDGARREQPVDIRRKEAGKPAQRPAPANDNSRRIWALTAAAVAAAAAFMIWAKMDGGPGTGPTAHTNAPITAQRPPSPIEVPRNTAQADVPTPDGDLDVGVEVAAVDFGSGQGSIFYVPTGAAGAGPTTTVVWLADDDSGGTQ